MANEIHHGLLEGYWEQGWEGRIEYSLFIEGLGHPFFLESGDRLTIFNEDGSVLWSGTLRFAARKPRENHNMPNEIWADTKQAGVPYAQWIEWFWRKPPLKATYEVVEDKTMEVKRSHADVRIHPPVLTLIFFVFAFAMEWMFPFSLELPQFMKVFGAVLVFAGLTFAFLGVREFARAHTTLDPHGSVSALVTSGVYRFSRNPIYVGFVCALIGIPLAVGTVWGAAFSPMLVWGLNTLVIQHEEAYLEKKFGDEYARYKSRVRRWV